MQKEDSIKILEKLEKGMFCTVNIPIYNNEKTNLIFFSE